MWKGGSGTVTLVVGLGIVATTIPSPLVHPFSSSWPLSLYCSSACGHEEKGTSMDEETVPLFDAEDGGSIDLDFEKGLMTTQSKYCPSVLATLLYDRKGDDGGGIYTLSAEATSPAVHLWSGRKRFSNWPLGCSRGLWQHSRVEDVNNLADDGNRPPLSPRASLNSMADLPVRLRLQPYLKEANYGGCGDPNPQELTSTSIFDGLSCIGTIGERSMASLKTLGELYPQKTGTTLAGVVYDGGVVIGADTRSTSGDIVADKFAEKVHPLAHNMAACGAGTSADCDKVTQNIRLRLELVMQQDVGEKEVSVFTALKMLCTTLFINPNISGSGSLAAISFLEKGFRSGMLREEAEKLVRLAILAGIENDLHSGSKVHLCTITKDGTTFSKEIGNNDSYDAGADSHLPEPNHRKQAIRKESGVSHNIGATDSDGPKYYVPYRRKPSVRVKTEKHRSSLRSIPELQWVHHPLTTAISSPHGKREASLGGEGVNIEMGPDKQRNHSGNAKIDSKINSSPHRPSLKIVTGSSDYLLDNVVEPL